jgi:D-threo-aldose 1-dehydrogenase
MYGLGRAESELAPYLQAQRDQLTVTTKFGIDASALGRTVGRVQAPLRALLARRSGLQQKARESGAGPSAGAIGRLLYTATGYDARAAARSLHRSLHTLGTDYLDIFVLHDPAGSAITELPELVGFLDDQLRAGTIRAWGVAGSQPPVGSDAGQLLKEAAVVQQRDDLFCDVAALESDKAVITFGALARVLPTLLAQVAATPSAAEAWTQRLGAPPDAQTLAGFLLREATRRNSQGVVLFSTSRPERVDAAVRAVDGPEA